MRGGALKAQTTKPHDNTTQHTCMSGPGRVRGGRERGIVTYNVPYVYQDHLCLPASATFAALAIP